ncbi:MAG: aspartyl protease family protein [Planctomycetes bacterium]|nr:aspartyl protease family protein [Planctomycetota bacterium]
MPAYDSSFKPPAPVADVTVAHPLSGLRRGTLRGKLDCGADITVLPERVVTQLGLTPRGHIWTRGFDGTYSRRPVFYVRFLLEGFDLPSVRCVAADRTTVLVGRNVLNRFVLILDGKNLTFDLQDPP